MFDNDLIKAFLPILTAGFTNLGLSNFQIVQSNQPTQQGAQIDFGIYFYKLFDYLYGFPSQSQTINLTPPESIIKRSFQNYETTFQISAWSRQDPTNTNQLTASDVINQAYLIMSNEDTSLTLQAVGIGIIRITEVRNPYFKNEYDQYEASPSFDFTLLYQRELISTVPISTKTNFNIYRV